ncbi:MAG: DMT family transporter [Symbiobacteriia bacterium]
MQPEHAGRKQPQREGLRSPYIWLVAAPLFWSGNMVFGRVLAQAVPPFGLSAVRWLVSTLVLAAFTLRVHGRIPWPRGQAWWPVAVMAVSGVAGFTPVVYLALHSVGSVEASLIQSSTPVFALLLALLFTGEGLGWHKALGALLTISGVAAIVSHGGLQRLLHLQWGRGDTLMLLAAFLWAVYTVAARSAARWLSPLAATLHSAWLGLLLLLPAAAWEWLAGAPWRLSLAAWTGVAYVSVFPSAVAFLAWNYGVSRIGAGRASVFNNLLPLFTAVWAVLLLGEPVGPAEALGGALILAGVSLVATRHPAAVNRDTMQQTAASRA